MTDETSGNDAFSKDETHAIRRMLDAHDAQPLCPRCRNRLKQEGPLAGGGSVGLVWRVSCETCNVSTFVAESMARPRYDEVDPNKD